jgi:lysozyme
MRLFLIFSGILLVTQNTPNTGFTQYTVEDFNMDIPQQAVDLVKQFEGTRLTSYQDSAGFWTVGVGHKNATPPPCPDCIITITQEQADEYLQNDLKHTADGVMRLVTVPLTDEQLSALISFAFNLGLHSLQTSTLLKELNSGNYAAAAQQFLQWDHSGVIVVAGLERRRQAEHDLFMKGDSNVTAK